MDNNIITAQKEKMNNLVDEIDNYKLLINKINKNYCVNYNNSSLDNSQIYHNTFVTKQNISYFIFYLKNKLKDLAIKHNILHDKFIIKHIGNKIEISITENKIKNNNHIDYKKSNTLLLSHNISDFLNTESNITESNDYKVIYESKLKNYKKIKQKVENKLRITKEIFNNLIIKYFNKDNYNSVIDNDLQRILLNKKGKTYNNNLKKKSLFNYNEVNNNKNTYKKYSLLSTNNEDSNSNTNNSVSNIKINSFNNNNIYENIHLILNLFDIYRKDIGYMQGQSMLCLYLYELNNDIYKVFKLFTNIVVLSKPFCYFYKVDKSKINKFISKIDKYLKDNSDKLFYNCIKDKIEMFIIDWVFTFFTNTLKRKIF